MEISEFITVQIIHYPTSAVLINMFKVN